MSTCPSTAARCRCHKDDGHVEAGDEVHECHPDRCTGAWTGSDADGTFEVVRLPFPVGAPRPWPDDPWL